MERTNDTQAQEMTGWDNWDAVPRDGPAVFIIDTAAWSKGTVKGRWCNPLAPVEEVQAQLRELLGREPADDDWAIVDQVGLGPLMMTETPRLVDLHEEVTAMFGGSIAVDSTTLRLLPT